jgi:hypothetical protein
MVLTQTQQDDIARARELAGRKISEHAAQNGYTSIELAAADLCGSLDWSLQMLLDIIDGLTAKA